jgi:hypothetical protein
MMLLGLSAHQWQVHFFGGISRGSLVKIVEVLVDQIQIIVEGPCNNEPGTDPLRAP